MILYKALLILAWIRKRQSYIAGIATAAVLVTALAFIIGLNVEIDAYEARLAALNAEMDKYETAAHRNEILTTDNAALEKLNETLGTENEQLAATNGELERQNGELLKKFDGLSKPN